MSEIPGALIERASRSYTEREIQRERERRERDRERGGGVGIQNHS